MHAGTHTGTGRAAGYAELWRVALPLLVNMGAFTLMQFVDRVFLAWHSRVSIQAALPAGILSFTFLCVFMALAQYAGTFVAQYHGAGDARGCGRATAQGLFLAVLSWPVLLLLLPVGRALLRSVGHAPEVTAEELTYFSLLTAGGVHVPLAAAAGGFFSGRGDTRTPMRVSLGANALNAVLDYGLIFGRWGLPALGIAGAAWATVLSGLAGAAVLLALYFAPAHAARHGTRATLRWDGPLMRRIVRFGFPSGLHLLLDVGSFTVFVLLTGRLGAEAFTASNIAFSVNNLAFMPLIAIGTAASILVGQHQGRGDGAEAARAGWRALHLGLAYMAAIGLSFALLPGAYFALFAEHGPGAPVSASLLSLGRRLLLIMAAWGCFDATNIVLSGALKGAGDTRFVMGYALVTAWCVWLPGEVLLLFVFRRGILAAWLWLLAYVACLAIGFLRRFGRGRWKTIDLLGRGPAGPPARPTPDAVTALD